MAQQYLSYNTKVILQQYWYHLDIFSSSGQYIHDNKSILPLLTTVHYSCLWCCWLVAGGVSGL